MKNNEKLNEAIGNIDNKMIEAAYNRQTDKKDRSGLFQIISSAAAVIAVAVFAVFLSQFAKKDDNIAGSNGNGTEITTSESNDKENDLVFMTQDELSGVSKIRVTSLPEGYDYSFEGEKVKPITEYLTSLHPLSIDDSDGYTDGMTWVIELTYTDGTVSKLYHIANSYIRKENDGKKYYKLSYEEANEFNSVISGNKIETTGSDTIQIIPESDELTKTFVQIIGSKGWYNGLEYNKLIISEAELKDVLNITPAEVKEKIPDVNIFKVGSDGDIYILYENSIYSPFISPVGCGLNCGIIPKDYNNDSSYDLIIFTKWYAFDESDKAFLSVIAYDIQKKESKFLYVDYAGFEKSDFDYSYDGENLCINGKPFDLTKDRYINPDAYNSVPGYTITEDGHVIRNTKTSEENSIIKRFVELIAQNGRLTNGTVKEFNIENAESIKNVTPDDFKDQLPGVYIFDVDNHKFIMTDGVIYEPFTTFGGTVFAAIPCDYNKDGVKDIVALTTWGSGLSYESVETFDMKTKQSRSIYVKNVLFEDMFEFECKNDEIYINGTKVNITDNGILPSDFRFSFTWNTFGISSYDSATGTLVKTRDATDVSKYTAAFKMTDKELIKVYSLFSNLINYPDTYDPYNDPNSDTKMMSTPNRTVIISFTAFGYEKTITCNNICFGAYGGYDDAAQTFLEIEKQLEDIITNSDVWQSFPDYEFLYD